MRWRLLAACTQIRSGIIPNTNEDLFRGIWQLSHSKSPRSIAKSKGYHSKNEFITVRFCDWGFFIPRLIKVKMDQDCIKWTSERFIIAAAWRRSRAVLWHQVRSWRCTKKTAAATMDRETTWIVLILILCLSLFSFKYLYTKKRLQLQWVEKQPKCRFSFSRVRRHLTDKDYYSGGLRNLMVGWRFSAGWRNLTVDTDYYSGGWRNLTVGDDCWRNKSEFASKEVDWANSHWRCNPQNIII